MHVTTPEAFLFSATLLIIICMNFAFSFVWPDDCAIEDFRVEKSYLASGQMVNNLTLFIRSVRYPDLTADVMIYSAPAVKEPNMLRAMKKFAVGQKLSCGVYPLRFAPFIEFVLSDFNKHRTVRADTGEPQVEIVMGVMVVIIWFVLEVLLRIWACTRVEYHGKDE